jgi:hypothetical protein
MSVPTKGEKFAELVEHLRLAEEAAAMLGHLHADEDKTMSHGWLGVSQLLNRTVKAVTDLATRGPSKWN